VTLLVRTKQEKDEAAIHKVNYLAFGNREDEARLVERFPDEVFRVCELNEQALKNVKGELKYPSAFFGIETDDGLGGQNDCLSNNDA